MTSNDLKQYIDTHDINAVILPLAEKTLTVSDAARVLGVETGQIIKSILFKIKKEPLLAINNGMQRIDRRKLAAHLEVGRGQVKLASPEQAFDITGFVVGSMPPFGHKQRLKTVIDLAIKEQGIIYGGGGDINAMMRMTSLELLRVVSSQVAEISETDGL